MDPSLLLKRFRDAALPLKIVGGPLNLSNPDIFQMDIMRSRRAEYFRVWPGGEGNRADVLSVDPGFRQLVLLVNEPPRRFTERVAKRDRPRRAAPQPAQEFRARLAAETDTHWIFERWTREGEHRYLCGLDERHLFVAEIRGGTTIREAHASLKPAEVWEVEQRTGAPAIRQGEWFFIELTADELRRLAAILHQGRHVISRHASVGPAGGHPHIAQEAVAIPRAEWKRSAGVRREEVFARGSVRHPDHAAVHLPTWHRVIRNAEVADPRSMNGIYWID